MSWSVALKTYTHLTTNERVVLMLMQGTDLSIVSQERLDEMANMLNTRPRQTLCWRFPMKVLVDYLQLSQTNNLQTIN